MPVIPLAAISLGPPVPVADPAGGVVRVPRPQFRCLLEVPGLFFPCDAVIDTGAPFLIFPQTVWSRCRPGTDYELLPFVGPNPPPAGRVLGWQFAFRVARFLVPLAVLDAGLTTRVERPGVVAAFAAGDPPGPPGRKALPAVILGLWGGALEGGRIAVERSAAGVAGELQYP